MLVFEAKLRGNEGQYRALDEALRTARFVRNSCLKYWIENKGVGRYDLNKYCKVLRLSKTGRNTHQHDALPLLV